MSLLNEDTRRHVDTQTWATARLHLWTLQKICDSQQQKAGEEFHSTASLPTHNLSRKLCFDSRKLTATCPVGSLTSLLVPHC